MTLENNIIIYQTEDGRTSLEVRLENENVWLTANQMAMLFGRDEKTVRKHINNAIREELSDAVVVAKFATTTQHGTIEGKTQTHDVSYFNLDVIISVGYRVKSQNGVTFRRWANSVLKQYLVKGYAIHDRIRKKQIEELRQLVQMVGRTMSNQQLPDSIESQDLLDVVVDYTYALDTLDNYDYERLSIGNTTKAEPFHATYESAMQEILRLRERFGSSDLFGHEKDSSFKSSIGQIYQTFDGIELYQAWRRKRLCCSTLW